MLWVVFLLLHFVTVDQALSQEFAKGGGFFGSWKQQKTNLSKIFISLESDWGGYSVRIRWSLKKRSSPIVKRFFRSRLGDLKKKKKKGLHQNSADQLQVRSRKKNSTFLLQITASPSQLLLPNPIGGATFIFGAKIGLKSTKNVVFSILFRQMGRGCSPSGYATAVDQGRKYRLVFSSRYCILRFSVIDYRRLFALNFFYRLLLFLWFLLTDYRVVESLYFTFVLIESA